MERLYGIEHGGDHGNQYKEAKPNNSVLTTQSDIATQMGVSVDTLQNYKMLATIIDVMEWMINTQLGRRNLPPQQRIAVVKKFEKKIQEQAKSNQILGGGDKRSIHLKPTHTDKELAKLVGVGT